jgi:UDP-glucose 4-epimerase
MKKKYLVTGASGFIGSTIAQKLLNDNHEIWTIDNLSTGFVENLPEGIRFIEGNCQDQKSINALGNIHFDAILHFAGQSSGEISFDNPVDDLRTNTEATLKLIQYGLNNNCNRFIYASSMSVYGEVPDEPISEDYSCNPLSFYGVGKLASEHYLRIYKSKGLRPTSLRLFNVYGPGQNLFNLRQGMVSIYLAQMLHNQEIIVKGSPDRFRDFIYIDDVVQITMNILNKNTTLGKIYNIGTGVKTTVKQILDKLINTYGEEIKINYSDPTPGDQLGITADTGILSNDLELHELVTVDEGLRRMVVWAKSTINK